MREKDWFTKCIVFLNNLIVHISTILITITNRLHDIFIITIKFVIINHIWFTCEMSMFYLFMFCGLMTFLNDVL